ncbi:TPM domain-containing protein [uncultured Zoogloea sp.]|uniref:TPM domain-containing protein n=1 Tax=uncultured Zoogloea sp. TaxID=160237 RepID=UPI0026073D94|nr:TPM domain-containing protein [uncultured Zoogloea sp.]
MALARVIGLLAGLWLGLFGLAFAQELQPVPALSAHVTDTVGLLPEDRRQALESQLVQLEKDKGAQLAVLIVSTTRPEPIESYSLRVAEAWRLGRKGVDDGVLFVVARDDRRMRVEVGYGLEGAVPDAIAKRIVAEVVAPRFKAGDFPGGIEAGVTALIARINGEALPAPAPGAAGADDQQMGLEEALVLGIIFTLVVGSVLKAIFGRLLGSTIAAGIVGVGAWTLTSVLLVGAVGAVLAFIFSLVAGSGGAGRIGGGPTIGGGFGGGFGGRGGGGGWSGGGGGFGGGGASGGW